MGCDSPEVNVGRCYGKMPEEKTKLLAEGKVRHCTVKNANVMDRAYELKIDSKEFRIHAPRGSDAEFLANALLERKVRMHQIERPCGKDGDYSINSIYSFEFLDGPLAGRNHEISAWETKEHFFPAMAERDRRYNLQCIEGVVNECKVEEKSLNVKVGKKQISISIPEYSKQITGKMPDPHLLRAGILGSQIRFETYKTTIDPRRMSSAQYSEFMHECKSQLEDICRLSILSGPMKGYEFEYGG